MSNQSAETVEQVRGHELMCETCGCTRFRCLTKFDGECCETCEHPPAPVVPHSIRGDFCGQQQPHQAHGWRTPVPYGSTALSFQRQCAGLSTPTGEGVVND